MWGNMVFNWINCAATKNAPVLTCYSVLLFFIILSLSFTSHAVLAQQDTNEIDVEVIEVRSFLRPATLAETASNIASLSDEVLQSISATHVTEALQRLPGTWISRGNSQEHLTAIRSPVLTGAGACGAFLMAEDSVPLRASGFCNVNQLFGVNTEQAQQIEVIRGPAGVLFGSNAVHGVINVLTPDASIAPYLTLDVGPNDYQRVGFLHSVEGNTQQLTVYGNLTSDGGYKENSGFGQEKLSLVHATQNGSWDIRTVFAYTNLNQETAGFIEGDEAYRDKSLKRQNPNPEAYRDSRSLRAYSQWRYRAEDNSEWRITPYIRWHEMTFLQHFVPWQPVESNGHESVGVNTRWSKEQQNISYVIGMDAELTNGDLNEYQEYPFSATLPQGEHYDFDVTANNASFYVDLDWWLTENLKIQGGSRFSHIEYDYNNHLPEGNACTSGVTGCRFTRPASQDVSFSHLTHRIALLYPLDSQWQVYINAAQGFRAPQVTELFRLQAGQLVADLKEEKTKSMEIGARYSSSNMAMELNVFQQDKSQVIIQDTQRQVINGGETQHQGVEASISWDVVDNFKLNAALSYAQHTYENDIQISRVSIKGNDIDTAPRWLGNITGRWQLNDTWHTELEATLMDEYYLDPENTARYDGHHLVNFRLHWQATPQTLFSLRIRNLLDQDYAERADYSFGNYRYFVGEPRSVFFGLKYSL